MAILKCRHCQGEISANARQVQCPHCAALFPFACAKCGCSLRAPFAVFSDERYLSQSNEPLCAEHFLRLCPDCKTWFNADENPGFFRCASCNEKHSQKRDADDVAPWDTDNLDMEERWIDADTGAVLVASNITPVRSPQMNIPILVAIMNLLTRLLRNTPSNHS